MAYKFIEIFHEQPAHRVGQKCCQILEIGLDGNWRWPWIYIAVPIPANDEYLDADFDFRD